MKQQRFKIKEGNGINTLNQKTIETRLHDIEQTLNALIAGKTPCPIEDAYINYPPPLYSKKQIFKKPKPTSLVPHLEM